MSDDDIRRRLDRLEHGQDAMRSDISSLRGEVGSLRGDMTSLRGEVTEIKAILSHLMPMMIRIDEKLASMPSAAEFYELRGRVEEISRRQPTTLGYTPPQGRTA